MDGSRCTYHPDPPVGVLIYCYAMRSDRFNPNWTISLLVLDTPYTGSYVCRYYGNGVSLYWLDTVPPDLPTAHRAPDTVLSGLAPFNVWWAGLGVIK
jgi:hypothetical protein